MNGNFKLVRKISFIEPHYSSTPIVFENVYVDRFNSIFKGFYLLRDENTIKAEQFNPKTIVTFKKIKSTERFGFGLKASDIVEADIVPAEELTYEQKTIIVNLNRCIDEGRYIIENPSIYN